MLFSYSMYVWLEQCWNLISWSDLFLSSTLAADLLFLWQLLKVWLSRGLLGHQLTKTIKILLQTFNSEIDFCKSSFKQGHLSSQHGLEFSKHSTLVNTVSCTKHKVIKGYFIEKTADNWQQLGIVMSAFLFLNKRIYPYITDYSMWFSFIYDMAARILQMYVFSLSWTLLCWGDPQCSHNGSISIDSGALYLNPLLKGCILPLIVSCQHTLLQQACWQGSISKWQSF